MTFSELIDQITSNAGDDSPAFRTKCRRWLNLARSDIAAEALWKYALRAEATITTSSATTTGIYTLSDTTTLPNGIEFILGDSLYDQTNENTITHESKASQNELDPAKNTTGPPMWWGDAGATAAGARRVYLWPIPDGTYTIMFDGYALLTDIDETNDADTVDPFFGPVPPWQGTFVAGMRYYYDLDNNEDPGQVGMQERKFIRQIGLRKMKNRLTLSARQRLDVVNTQMVQTIGRFDPAHYNNR